MKWDYQQAAGKDTLLKQNSLKAETFIQLLDPKQKDLNPALGSYLMQKHICDLGN